MWHRCVRSFNIIWIGLLLSLGACLRAQSERFVIPDFRGAGGALFAGWDDFETATGANAPDVPGSVQTGFTLTQLDPSAFVTSSGNIYSFSTTLSHRIDVGGLSAAPVAVVLQTRTVGATINPGTIALEAFDGVVWSLVGPPVNEQLFSQMTGSPGFGSAFDEARRYTWLAGDSVVVTALRLSFSATGPSQSLQAVALDIAPVSAIPEPASATLLVAGGVIAFTMLRRPKRR